MPQLCLIHYYSRSIPGFCCTILRQKRNLFYCATSEMVWNPAQAGVNNRNHSSWGTRSPVSNGHSFLLRRCMEISAGVWLEKVTSLLFLFRHLPACSGSRSWDLTEKSLARKVIRERLAAQVSLFSELVDGLSIIAKQDIFLSWRFKKKKKNTREKKRKEKLQTKTPVTYLRPWYAKFHTLDFVVTSEWI